MNIVEVIEPPTIEPVSIEMARAHLHLDDDTHDFWLQNVGIPAARAMAEGYTGQTFAETTLRVVADRFPDGALELRRGPVKDVLSVKYVDGDGIDQTLAPPNYSLDNAWPIGWLIPVSGWPATKAVANGVRVTYLAGFDPQKNPDPVVAILLILGHLFKNRESVSDKPMSEIPISVQWILRQHHVLLGMA